MSLSDKYQSILTTAQSAGISNLRNVEKDGVLYISGIAPSNSAKQSVWDAFQKIDPEFRASDLIIDIQLDPTAQEEYTVQSGDSLDKISKKYPGLTWKDIYDANKELIKNPDLIQPGWKLIIPTK